MGGPLMPTNLQGTLQGQDVLGQQEAELLNLFQSLQQQIQNAPEPQQVPVPPVASPLASAGATFASTLASSILRNPGLALQTQARLERDLRAAQQAQAQNVAIENRAAQQRHQQLLGLNLKRLDLAAAEAREQGDAGLELAIMRERNKLKRESDQLEAQQKRELEELKGEERRATERLKGTEARKTIAARGAEERRTLKDAPAPKAAEEKPQLQANQFFIRLNAINEEERRLKMLQEDPLGLQLTERDFSSELNNLRKQRVEISLQRQRGDTKRDVVRRLLTAVPEFTTIKPTVITDNDPALFRLWQQAMERIEREFPD
jgi:hypothetical protein